MGYLVYDADCGFCTRAAGWLNTPTVSWAELDLAAAGATELEAEQNAGWLVDGKIVALGAEAIGLALVASGGAATLAGRVILLPSLRRPARGVYRIVANNRHRLPGGRACRL